MNHSDLGVGEIHSIFNWVWADSIDRLATSVTVDDVGKIGLQEDNSNVYFLEAATPTWTNFGVNALADLTDVDLSGVTDGDILVYNSGIWYVLTPELSTLQDVDITGISNGDVLVYNAGTWEVLTPELSTLQDVDITGIVNGNTLVYNSGTWVPGSGGGGGVSQFTATVYASGDWDNEAVPIWQAPKDAGVTIEQVNASVLGASTPTLDFNLEKRAYNTIGSVGTDLFATEQTAPATGIEITSFAVDTLSAKDYVMLATNTSAESGVVTLITVTVYFTT